MAAGCGRVGIAAFLFCLYPLLLWWLRGDALAFAAAQHHWGREFSPLGPLVAIGESMLMIVALVLSLFSPHAPTKSFHEFQSAAINNAFASAALVLFVVLLVMVYRRFGARSPYFVYAAVSLAIPLFSPIDGNPLLSLPRFGLVIFPFFIALATSGRARRGLHAGYVVGSTSLLVVASATFALYGWVS